MKRILLLVLILACHTAAAYNIDTLVVMSKSMYKEVRNIVITPNQYSKNGKAYPVLYMLHGATDDYMFWPEYVPEVREFADRYQVILVFPDGARTSWYFDSPVDSTFRYETYISKELVSHVDQNYNTIANSKGRAITGLSMGGHGAFYLAFRHPDIWGAAGSTSGGMDFRPFPDEWDLAKRLGSFAEYPENWERNTVVNMVPLIDKDTLALIFDCGTEDFFYEGNNALHHKLLNRGIPHTYIEHPGGHTLDYWLISIEYHLIFFEDYFTRTE
ncbi:alpha/beta hydrolase family protein [Fulvivirga kasyanovii]|uniref:Esterase family protein n=1 Tax=Fulvivirga kasyanovii TaxID=396812 RepID=A0ABW9RI83_9BACT|nr:alpha/beta hydrolase family protein [Fulvivirga kasyanovii]MTI23774.1 esterase family protein [Fulvivirga kasyanovii]